MLRRGEARIEKGQLQVVKRKAKRKQVLFTPQTHVSYNSREESFIINKIRRAEDCLNCHARHILRIFQSLMSYFPIVSMISSLNSASKRLGFKYARSLSLSSSPYPHLLKPLDLKSGHQMRNRVLMGSMHTGLEEAGSGVFGSGPLDRMAEYFAERFALDKCWRRGTNLI
jgi:hypothetical protein